MDTLILCGGLGSRLKSEVVDRQKCVAKINGIPFLKYLIEYVNGYGYNRFILCVGHKAETVKEMARTQLNGLEIIFSEEPKRLGTGGAVKRALPHVNTEQVLILNGDSICQADLATFEKFHTSSDKDVSMVLAKADKRQDCGNVHVNESGRILSFTEKSGRSSYVNAGIYMFSRSVFELFPAEEVFSLEKDVFPKLLDNNFFGYVTDAPLLDIGTPERLREANTVLGN